MALVPFDIDLWNLAGRPQPKFHSKLVPGHIVTIKKEIWAWDEGLQDFVLSSFNPQIRYSWRRMNPTRPLYLEL